MAFEKRAAERQHKGEAAIEEARGKIQAARDKVRPLAAILVAALRAESYTGGSSARREWPNGAESCVELSAACTGNSGVQGLGETGPRFGFERFVGVGPGEG